MKAITQYIQDTIIELKQVNWPTQRQALIYTGLVIAISISIALFTGVLDTIFSELLKKLIESNQY